jgi:hypothetical protein
LRQTARSDNGSETGPDHHRINTSCHHTTQKGHHSAHSRPTRGTAKKTRIARTTQSSTQYNVELWVVIVSCAAGIAIWKPLWEGDVLLPDISASKATD